MMTITSCQKKQETIASNHQYQQVFIKDLDTISTPTIFIEGLNLITKDVEKDQVNALEILALKHKWPLAMKTKSRELFEEILSNDFVIRGEDEFLTRQDYINDRVAGIWTIDTVRYQNLVLQFFDNKALLTYRNVLNGTDDNGVPDREFYTWADMYVKENGNWKILSSNGIDARYEY
jgi:hypothetical protein